MRMRQHALHGFRTWWSGAARFTPYVLLAIAVFAPAALAVSIGYSNVYATEWPEKAVATSLRIVQAGIMPIITLLHVAVDTALFCAALLHPVYAVCSAVLFLAGWGVQTGFWFRCYAHGAYDHDGGCAEHWLMHSFYGARCAFMMIVLLLYFTYMVFAAMAAHRWRRQRKQQRRGRDSDSFASDIPVAAASQAMASDDMELRDVSSK